MSKTFGPSFILLEIAGQVGPYYKLVSAFGERTDTIISMTIMRIIRLEVLRNIADQLEESFHTKLLGIEEDLTSQFLSRFLFDLGRRSRRVLFGSMIDNDGVRVYDLTPFKSSSRNEYLE